MDLKNDTKRQIKKVMLQIAEVAKNGNLAKVTELSHKASKLEDILTRVEQLETELNKLTQSSENISKRSPFRTLRIEVTQGMINQNLLTLTESVKRGIVRSGDRFNIECLPSEEKFETILVKNSNKLRERGAICRFYKDAGIKAHDIVLLIEHSKGSWILRKATRGE